MDLKGVEENGMTIQFLAYVYLRIKTLEFS